MFSVPQYASTSAGPDCQVQATLFCASAVCSMLGVVVMRSGSR